MYCKSVPRINLTPKLQEILMIHSRELSLKSLISSNEGIHLTCYLQNQGCVENLKQQIYKSILKAKLVLKQAMPEDEQNKFLQPLTNLVHNPTMLNGFKSNIGIFRTADSFRIISIPNEVETITVVASSFHIKPLLRWLQTDREFLFLGIKKDAAFLYRGSNSQVKLVDTVLFPEPLSKDLHAKVKNIKMNENTQWFSNWLYESSRKSSLPLFLAGEKPMIKFLNQNLSYYKLRKKPLSYSFSNNEVLDVVSQARHVLLNETNAKLDRALQEYKLATSLNLGQKNLIEIAKAAVMGKIKKLIVSDGMQIYGLLDKNTGKINIHPTHLNHQDDDLLDDIAQIVIERGGKVVVTSKDQLPKRRPILAILKDTSKNILQPTLGTQNFNQELQA